MRVLVLGSGAREHALAEALAASPSVRAVVVAPGNAGTSAEPIASAPIAALEPEPVVALAREVRADLVVVGPEAPLVAGVGDALRAAGVPTFGHDRAAAELEGSKVFLKEFARRWSIPTADFDVVATIEDAERAIRRRGAPVVVKADGLAAGKGVTVAATVDEALAAAREALVDGRFGPAGRRLVIEACLPGDELSVHAITDGERWVLLPAARDHKRLRDGDRGPNTGGMGAFAPSAALSEELRSRVDREIVEPTIRGMREEGRPLRGVLFAGLMILPDGTPMLLEHNVRFGDPETEVLVPLFHGDFAELLAGVAAGRLDPTRAAPSGPSGWTGDQHALAVVLAAAGYPETPRRGDVIRGLDAAARTGARVFHAGTARRGGDVVTGGGRVLAVTGGGASLADAKAQAYSAVEAISFEGAQHRRDIGASAL